MQKNVDPRPDREPNKKEGVSKTQKGAEEMLLTQSQKSSNSNTPPPDAYPGNWRKTLSRDLPKRLWSKMLIQKKGKLL